LFKNSVYGIAGIYAAFRDNELLNKTDIKKYKADFKRDQKVGYDPI
jgi:hypothetical protein